MVMGNKARRRRRNILMLAVLAAGVATAIVHIGYRRDLREAYARVGKGSEIADTACGPIEYALAGGGRNGEPVLSIHGAGGGFDQGLAFARPLAEDGHRVIAPSRFGYLRTPLPADASPAAQADAHACLLDALQVRRAVVIGGSAGAPSAMQLCLRHPQRCAALVLLVPLAHAPRDGAAPAPATDVSPSTADIIDFVLGSDFVFWVARHLARDTLLRTMLATPPLELRRADADERARVRQVLREVAPIRLRAAGLRNDAAIAAALPRYALERIAAPTLVIGVEDDLFGTWRNARYTAEHIPGARFVGYPSGGHLWVGRQRAVWSEVAGFIDTVQSNHPEEGMP